jgi:hypothetical protein
VLPVRILEIDKELWGEGCKKRKRKWTVDFTYYTTVCFGMLLTQRPIGRSQKCISGMLRWAQQRKNVFDNSVEGRKFGLNHAFIMVLKEQRSA